jgi:hypothetical protein
MNGFQVLLGVIAVDACVLGVAFLAIYQLNKAVSRVAARSGNPSGEGGSSSA